jgi:PAS domain S-box-containing protein
LTEHIHVLYVDDDSDLLKLGEIYLSKFSNFSVTIASGAAEAINLLKTRTFDAIISDYQMPEMNGIQFLKYLKEQDDPTPFVLFTGRGHEEVVIEALNSGADFYLKKRGDPVTQFTELSHEIRSAVARRRVQRDLVRMNKELCTVNKELVSTEKETQAKYEELSRKEQENRESEERFRGIFNSSLVGIAITDPQGTWLYFNEKVCTMLGYSPDELKTKTWGDLTPPENLKQEMEIFRCVLAGKEPDNIEKQYIRKDQSRIDVIVSTGVVRNPDGTINYFSSIIQDITFRKEAEKNLKHKNEELHAACEQIAASEEELRAQVYELRRQEDSLRITQKRLLWAQEIGKTRSWEYNPETNTIWESAEGLHIFGFPPVARNLPIDEIESCIPDRLRVNQALVDLITRDIPYDIEYIIHPADRSADKAIHSVARTENDSKGNLVRVIGIIQDITEHTLLVQNQQTLIDTLGETNERLESAYEELAGSEEELRYQYNSLAQTEESLRKTHEYLENLFAIANVPIIVWDTEFRIVRINHAFELIIGRCAEEINNTPLQNLFPPEMAILVARLLDTTHCGVRLETFEIPVLHKDGSLRTILWNTSTLFDIDGISPVATIAQGKDVTDERGHAHAKEAALVEIQKNLAQLSILNDEIRNPLTVIVTCADLLDDDDLVDMIMVQAQRIDGMVNTLDQRWVESEKVLNAIRKHYQIEIDQGDKFRKDVISGSGYPLTGSGLTSGADRHQNPLVEEVQAQLYTILDSIDALVYVADMDTFDLLFINQRGRGYFGNIAGKKCFQTLFPGQDKPCSFCTNHLLVHEDRSTGVYQWEFNDTQNGRWYDCRDRAIRWSDGRLVRLEISTDITKLRQAEQTIRESEQKYRLLAENIGDVIWTAGKEMQITYVSPSITALTGYSPEEFLALHPQDSLTSESLDRMGRSRQEFLNHVSSETIDQCHPAVLELEYRKKDGSVIATECTISLILTDEGEPVGVIGVTRDITARKRAEEALRENERRYREIFESLDDLYIQTDENGIITVLSPSVYPLSGWTPDDLIGIPVADLYVHPEERDILLSELKTNGFVKDYELCLTKKDGSPIPISLSGSVIQNVDGKSGGLRGSLRDISKRKQAEDTLRESEEKYRAISEYSHLAICIIDKQSRVIWANEEMVRMGGYSRDVIYAAETFAQFIAPESIEFVVNNFKKFIAGEEYEHQYMFSIIRADGQKRLCSKNMTDFTDRHGNKNLIISMLDITEKEQMEEALRESEKRFRSILQNVSTVAVQGYGMDGTVRYWNRASETFYGYSAEDALNKNLLDLIIPPDMRTDVQCAIQHMIDTGEVIPASELELMRKDGSHIQVYSSHVMVPVPGGDDEMYCIDIDLTDRIEAEKTLQKKKERFQLLVKNASDIIICINANGIQSYLSPAVERITGFTSEELTGINIVDLIHPDDRAALLQVWESCIHQPEAIFTAQYRYKHKTRNWVYLEATGQNFLHIPAVSTIVGTIRDITERKQTEEALYASNQKLRLLTSLTRHDVMNKLVAIHLLHDITLEESDLRKKDEYIIKAREITGQVEEIIKFTREYEDFGSVSSRWQQVKSLIIHAASETVHTGIPIEVTIPPDIEIFADPIIRKVFTTLIENAVRHAGNHTRIIFSCSTSDSHLIIFCEDDGVGIPSEEKELIFAHGFGKHTGMGLFLAREILAITGLSIREIGDPRKGARFEILVPDEKWRRNNNE